MPTPQNTAWLSITVCTPRYRFRTFAGSFCCTKISVWITNFGSIFFTALPFEIGYDLLSKGTDRSRKAVLHLLNEHYGKLKNNKELYSTNNLSFRFSW